MRKVDKCGIGPGRSGKPTLIIAGLDDHLAGSIDKASNIKLSFHSAPALYRVALLKSAYLAVAASSRRTPVGPTADLVRRDLVAVRDGVIASDNEAESVVDMETLDMRGPRPLEPRFALFQIGADDFWQLGVAMASFVVFGPIIEALAFEGLNGQALKFDMHSGNLPPEFAGSVTISPGPG